MTSRNRRGSIIDEDLGPKIAQILRRNDNVTATSGSKRRTEFHSMRSRALLLILVALLAAETILLAQLRVDVHLINVVATVTDTQGRYVPNLTQEDFVLEEDGKAQEITHFTQDDDVPVSVGIVLDTSGSMERKIRTATDAVDR